MTEKNRTVLVRLSEFHRELAKLIGKNEQLKLDEAINKSIEVYCKTHYSELYQNFKKFWNNNDTKEEQNFRKKSVYLISNPIDNTIKIGISNDVDKRLYQLQYEYKNKFLCISKVYDGSIKDEFFLKNRFKDKQAYGEFFYLNANDINFVDTYFYNQNQ